jgi:hypothetical protein
MAASSGLAAETACEKTASEATHAPTPTANHDRSLARVIRFLPVEFLIAQSPAAADR